MADSLILQKSTITRDSDEIIFVITGDLTARKLTFIAKKDSGGGSAVLLQKLNQVAGGGDTELTAETLGTTPEKTKIVIFLNQTDTFQAYSRLYFYVESEAAADPNDIDVVAVGALILVQNISEIPIGAENVKATLTRAKYAHWSMVAGVITVKAMSGWTINPTAAESGGTVTITSSGSEIPLGALFDSTNKDFYTGAWTTASREIVYNDVTGTIEFWLEYFE